MSLRLFVESPLSAGLEFGLPEDAARHVQVRRLQPGEALRLFDGRGGEWAAEVLRMGKREVDVRVGQHHAIEREAPFALEIALGMPTNERMDALIEKATELGVAVIQPLQSERSVLRLDGERAARRVAHWQAVAVGASEQSGRTRVPVVQPVRTLAAWLAAQAGVGAGASGGVDAGGDVGAGAVDTPAGRFVLSTSSAPRLTQLLASLVPAADEGEGTVKDTVRGISRGRRRWQALSGPEGGLSADEEALAVAAGFLRLSLGALVQRADTAPLAWLAQMAVLLER